MSAIHIFCYLISFFGKKMCIRDRLRVYNDEIKRKTELRLAKKMLEAAEKEKSE